MVKKISIFACLFPVLFSLILCNLRSASAEAAYSSTTSSQPFVDPNLFIGLTEQTSEVDTVFNSSAVPSLLTDLGISSNYLICAGHGSDSESEPWAYPVLHLYAFDLNGVSITTDDDGYLLFSNVHMLYSKIAYANLVANTSGVYRTYVSDRSQYVSAYLDILYNPDTHYLKFTSQVDADSFSRQEYMSSSHQTVFGMDFYSSDYYFDDVLDVDVYFSPSLSGDVDLTSVPSVAIGEQVNTSVITDLYWSITNNSRSNIQYAINITSSDGIVWRYLSQEWCWANDITHNQSGFTNPVNGNTVNPLLFDLKLQYMGSRWHWISGSSDSPHNISSITIPWKNLPLEENVSYTLSVEACTTSADTVSIPLSEGGAPSSISLGDITTVYSSSFTITNKGGIVFTSDYNGYSNFIPYENEESYYKAVTSRTVAQESDGSFNYDDVSLFDSDNSWLQKTQSSDLTEYFGRLSGDYYNGYTYSGGSGFSSASVSGASSYVGGFFSFLGSVFSFFPAAWLQIITLGFVAILAIGIIKAVIK